MRAPISVIIPTLDAADDLPGCWASLMEGVQAGLIREVIVSDGGSQDETCDLARDVGAQLVEGAPSRGAQLQRGCRLAKGDWLLILHADTELETGWTGTVRSHLTQESGAYFKLRFRARGAMPKMVAGWANLRSRVFGLPYGDQGMLLTRTLYDAVGGYQDQPLMEDVALARSLRGRLICLPIGARTSARRYQQQGWLRRGSRNLLTLARYFGGTDPTELAEKYLR
ncbi:MAG: TIGR04283 family arsenosugar biosynthesis glycosyltransferase [Paracoccaceae bacterium]